MALLASVTEEVGPYRKPGQDALSSLKHGFESRRDTNPILQSFSAQNFSSDGKNRERR